MNAKKLKSRILLLLISVGWLAQVAGCGSAKDPGENIVISLPSNHAYIVPGEGASCADLLSFRTSGELSKSISEFRLNYPSFVVEWSSKDSLEVTMIRVTLNGSNITGTETTLTLDQTEIAPLLGISDAVLYGNANGSTVKINSKTKDDRNFPRCGLQVGGIGLVDNKKAFVARVTIELFGVATESDTGELYPVRKTTTGTAEYF